MALDLNDKSLLMALGYGTQRFCCPAEAPGGLKSIAMPNSGTIQNLQGGQEIPSEYVPRQNAKVSTFEKQSKELACRPSLRASQSKPSFGGHGVRLSGGLRIGSLPPFIVATPYRIGTKPAVPLSPRPSAKCC